MKKLFATMASLALLLSMSACSDATTSVSNENEALITVDNKKITKGEIYKSLLANGSVNSIITMITEYICEKEIPITDEIRQTADETLDSFRVLFETDEAWNDFLFSMGYTNEEDYYNERILLSARSSAIIEKYVEEELAVLKEEYTPRKVEVFQTSSEEDAKAALSDIQNGSTFEEVTTKYNGTTTTFTGKPQVLTSMSSLPENVWDNILTITEDNTLMPTVQFKVDLSTYYVIRVAETEVSDEEAKAAISAITDVTNAAFIYFLEKYDFTIYDIDVYNSFSTQAPDYIVQD